MNKQQKKENKYICEECGTRFSGWYDDMCDVCAKGYGILPEEDDN